MKIGSMERVVYDAASALVFLGCAKRASNSELAKAVGVSRSQVWRWVRGKSTPGKGMMRKLLALQRLNVEMSNFREKADKAMEKVKIVINERV